MHSSNVVMAWRKLKRGNWIIGTACKDCSRYFFPGKEACSQCSKQTEPYRFKGSGKVFSYTSLFSSPEQFVKQVPYMIAMVELDEGPRITAQLVDCESVEQGKEVEACIRKITADGESGHITYGIKFRPKNNFAQRETNARGPGILAADDDSAKKEQP